MLFHLVLHKEKHLVLSLGDPYTGISGKKELSHRTKLSVTSHYTPPSVHDYLRSWSKILRLPAPDVTLAFRRLRHKARLLFLKMASSIQIDSSCLLNMRMQFSKLESQDSDLRFMALNDILTSLTRGSPVLLNNEKDISGQIVQGLVRTLDDSNGEVQNMSVRW